MALVCAFGVSTLPAKGQAPAADLPTSGAETCVAVFTVMAYAYADDDLKERQLEEKKEAARADIRPQEAAVSTDALAPDDRIQQTMDILSEMMLERPAQVQVIAKECFRQYPPEIELN